MREFTILECLGEKIPLFNFFWRKQMLMFLDKGINGTILDHDLLMMTSALIRISRFDCLTHLEVDAH